MTDPESALDVARASAASMRASGAYGGADALGREPGPVTSAQMLKWALIDPDQPALPSSRRFSRPVKGVRRLLLRLLWQYHAELVAQQTRFNVAAAGTIRRLEERIDELERKLDEQGR